MNNTPRLACAQGTDARLRHLLHTDEPDPRSLAAAIMRTGEGFWYLLRASKRRHWLAFERILKVRARIGVTSIRELARQAHADTRTVKEALKYTLEYVALQVMEVFRDIKEQGRRAYIQVQSLRRTPPVVRTMKGPQERKKLENRRTFLVRLSKFLSKECASNLPLVGSLALSRALASAAERRGFGFLKIFRTAERSGAATNKTGVSPILPCRAP